MNRLFKLRLGEHDARPVPIEFFYRRRQLWSTGAVYPLLKKQTDLARLIH